MRKRADKSILSRIAGLPACGFFLLLSLGGCRHAVVPVASKTTLTIGVAEGAQNSPELGVKQFVSMFATEGLTQINSDGRVVQRLAAGWQWENDGLRLRVSLRPHARFHDGNPVSAARVAESLRALAADHRNWEAYPSLQQITDVRADGDLVAVVDLSDRSTFLLEDLSVPITGTRRDIGTGPYRVVRQTDKELELERFEDYYLGKPAIGRVVLKPFDTLRTTWASLLRGEVDMVTDVPASAVQFIRNDEVDVHSWQRWYQFVVAFNSKRGPLSRPEVRRALNLAIDRDAIIKNVLAGVGTPSTGPLWPKHWAYDRSLVPYQFDPATANSLLDAAAFHRGSVKEGIADGRLRFTCVVPRGYAVWEHLGLELQRQLYAVGVDMQLESLSAADYTQRLGTGRFEAALIEMISGPGLGRPYTFWRSAKSFPGARNTFGYENGNAERSFESIRTAVNDAAVLSATRHLQQLLMDDPPALFVAWTDRNRAVRREFVVYQDPGRDPLATLWQWAPRNPPQIASAR